jgi:hypothetical protein
MIAGNHLFSDSFSHDTGAHLHGRRVLNGLPIIKCLGECAVGQVMIGLFGIAEGFATSLALR